MDGVKGGKYIPFDRLCMAMGDKTTSPFDELSRDAFQSGSSRSMEQLQPTEGTGADHPDPNRVG